MWDSKFKFCIRFQNINVGMPTFDKVKNKTIVGQQTLRPYSYPIQRFKTYYPQIIP